MDILISAILGGIIGYFTNWLAIKMLFRPYEEKFILGFKLPFTPGLIPKEKNRIAQNIGVTVEDYLLSPQVILKSLEKDQDRLEGVLVEKLEDFREKDYRLGDLFKQLSCQLDGPVLEEKVRTQVSSLIKELDLSSLLVDYLRSSLAQEEEVDRLARCLVEEYEKLISSQASREEIEARIRALLEMARTNQRDLREYVSPDLVADLQLYIDKNHKILAYKLGQLLRQKDIELKIRSIIRNLVQTNLTGMLASLLPMDLVEDKAYQALVNYMSSQEGSQDLQNILRTGLDKLLDSSLADLMDNLAETIDEKQISQHLLDLLSGPRTQEGLVKLIKGQLKDLDLAELDRFIGGQIESFIENDKLWDKIFKLKDQVLESLGSIRINTIMDSLGLDGPRIYKRLRELFNQVMKKDGERIIKGLGLAKIVEETILGFDSQFTEQLILDIASKELRAITILGGFLGALIGLLNPLIQKLLA